MERLLNFDFKTTQQLILKASKIDEFKGKWELLGRQDERFLRELRQLATIQSIGSSTRIEGVTLSNTEIDELLKKTSKKEAFQTRDEQEVAGYYEALKIILDSHIDIALTENNIRSLHSQLMRFSTKDASHKGAYKQLPNSVVANYPDGTQRIIFRTTEPFLVAKEMNDLIQWTRESLMNKDIHPLFVIGTFVYEFLSIHPFQDGNGRMSRLLTTLLLLKSDYGFSQYVSLEMIIEERKTDYYRVLMNAQQQRGTAQEIIADWMLFFFNGLEELIARLIRKIKRQTQVNSYLNERQMQLLKFVGERKSVRIADVQKQFPDSSRSTLARDLKHLLNEGYLDKGGAGRTVTYFFSEEEE